MTKLPESTRLAYARQLADEAKTLVPGMDRLGEIAAELRADDLYQLLGFDTWERFCDEYIGVSKRTANRWISTWKQAAIPARSTELPKSITAGQDAAAGQNVPVVESKALNSATKKSEGGEPRGDRPLMGRAVVGSTPTGEVPADPPSTPSSGGARDTAPPRAPTVEPPPTLPAPPDPSTNGRIPSDRQLAARVLTAMHDIEPDAAGPVLTPEDATMVKGWASRAVKAWQRSLGIDEDAPAARAVGRMGHSGNLKVQLPPADGPAAPRSPGHVIRPKDRKAKAEAAAPVDPANCRHPKDRESKLPYAIMCGVCGSKLR